ncbi:hypothetical protein [Silvimonas soli]|uniref:hypothetical protein n=1 Tax=Silvimonas soli TaxID=2980100 RepID=UPI0024B346A5|nr:hypothetical protein [Silvimonas soli]
MNSLNEILNEALKAISKDSDRQLAIHMGVTASAVSLWRHGKSTPDMYALMELQKILQRDARELSAIIEAERAKTEERRGYWEDVKRAFSKSALSIAVVAAATIALPGGVQKAYAGEVLRHALSDDLTAHLYIMFK